MPPVKFKKCFAEKMGEALHPLEKSRDKKDESRLPLYGYKYPNKRRPKWRKALEEAPKEEKVNNTVKEDQINCPADSLYKEPERQENQTEENEIPPLPPIESVMASLNITEQLSEPKVINQKQEPPQEKTPATFTGSVITFSESD